MWEKISRPRPNLVGPFKLRTYARTGSVVLTHGEVVGLARSFPLGLRNRVFPENLRREARRLRFNGIGLDMRLNELNSALEEARAHHLAAADAARSSEARGKHLTIASDHSRLQTAIVGSDLNNIYDALRRFHNKF